MRYRKNFSPITLVYIFAYGLFYVNILAQDFRGKIIKYLMGYFQYTKANS